MIAYIDGMIEMIEEDNVVLDVGGIGINVRISAGTAAKLPGIGEAVKLYTYTCVREDAFLLYGFLSRNDLDIFKKCITVSGIGPKGALSILSVMDADTLRYAIVSGDAKAIAKAPGVGARTAERLIVELKDKLKIEPPAIGREAADAAVRGSLEDNAEKQAAIEALVSLGYGLTESMKAVNAVEDANSMDSGQLLKAALKKMF